jgi:chemosensory pili system protein ChpA (sensor histidine kinase/response regulator)
MESQSTGRNDAPGDDLSALAWVHGELRRALENAHKALRRYLKESEALGVSDVDVVDPSVLRNARNQIHQGVGALELVGLPEAAHVLRSAEMAVQKMVAKPTLVTVAAVETVEQVSFGLLDFLSRQLAGKAISPVALFPQYRAAQQLAGADRVHPADLWQVEWQWRELPADPSATPRTSDEDARGAMETLMLTLMRHSGTAAAQVTLARMSDLCADLGAGARQLSAGAPVATFWQLAAAVLEAQAGGLLASDVYTKRLSSRLLAQLRMDMRGQSELSDRLAQDLLFFCHHAAVPAAEHKAPRLTAVRKTWRLADAQATADYQTPRLGRFDPALLALAKKRVAVAKDSWSAVAGGEQHRLGALGEQFALVGDSLQKLLPDGEVLAQSLQAAVEQTVHDGQAPAPGLAMEVATGILYLDATLDDGELDQPELGLRVRALARRVDEVRGGAEPQPLESWMEELYRRVSDRQTMGSVVQELRASLSEIEKQIDQYFRNPAERQVLIPVPAQLSSMRGVLSVLGLDQASAAALHMRDDVDALAQTEVDPHQAIQTGTFDRLADNLGALSFLIDMISVQPQLAKSLFRFDPETGSLSAVMGQTGRSPAYSVLSEARADQPPAPLPAASPEPSPAPAPAAAPESMTTAPLLEQVLSLAEAVARPEVQDEPLIQQLERVSQLALLADQRDLARRLERAAGSLRESPANRATVHSDLAETLIHLAGAGPEERPAPAPVPPPAPVPAGGTGLEEDAEMREIFIEEAREVVTDAGAALERLADAPDNAGDMTAVRRAFHTLKGSSRMVGLRDFGEAAWACEQLYNARLAHAPRVDGALRLFTGEALAYLGDWTEAIAAGQQRGHNAPAVAKAADSLRLSGVRLAIEPAEGAIPAAASVMPGPAATSTEALTAATVLPFVLEPSSSPETDTRPQPETLVAPDLELTEFNLPPVDDAAPASAERVVADLEPLPEQEPAPAALPVEAGGPSFGLSLDFDEPLAEPEAPPTAHDALDERVPPDVSPAPGEPSVSLETLLQRVPDLPTAEDLALTQPDRSEVEEPAPTEAAAFDLDLASFDEPAAAVPSLPEWPALDLPQPASLLSAEPAPAQVEPLPAFEPVPPVPVPEVESVELDLADLQDVFEDAGPALTEPGTAAPPVADDLPPLELPQTLPAEPAVDEAVTEPLAVASDDEQVKLIGPLRISIPLFNIFLNEADELSRRLGTELAEWSLEHERHPVPESSAALAHSLAGNSATVGYADLSALARALEHALMRSHAAGHGRPGEAPLFNDAAEEIHRLLHQFAAGFLRPVDAELMARLAEHERLPQPVATEAAEAEFEGSAQAAAADSFDVHDALDPELFPIFEEEAEELLPQLQMRLREWLENPGNADAPAACMRTLHTFKGGARLAGAMRLGEMAHQLEATIEQMAVLAPVPVDLIEPLPAQADAMAAAFEALSHRHLPAPLHPQPLPQAVVAALPPAEIPVLLEAAAEPLDVDLEAAPDLALPVEPTLDLPLEVHTGLASTEPVEPQAPAAAPPAPRPLPVIDWARFGTQDSAAPAPVERLQAAGAAVRVRAGLLDRLVNQAGEVSITRARIDADVKVMQSTLVDLTDSLERMRRQLRDIELQAETQISSRMEAAKAAAQTFDPLEMDRFTRFQELTRFMAESVNDVATLQRGLQRTLQSTEDELAAQARLTRELQDDLLRTRMVEFDSLSERLYRTVRQAAKETGKQVRLEILGGAIEIDRGVLERMVGSFEHLLRNCVAHGVELPEARQAAGKDATGLTTVTVTQAGNEVAIEFGDDGSGLDLGRIRDRALERGLLSPGAQASDAELAQLIFHSGFSTAEAVTELSGRGVGLDVVRAEVNAMGGRIETQSAPGQGTRFRLLLPLTTAVTQVVMLRCGSTTVAVPSTLVELVRRVPTADVQRGYEEGVHEFAGEKLPFFWLAALLREGGRGDVSVGRTQTVVIVRSAAQRVAVHVDEVVGNQEVVVKNVGPQLSRLPGLAGVTMLPSGQVALIYNPVALATVYADAAHALSTPIRLAESVPSQAAPVVVRAPLVMVVDDSLTVRRVTQRLLVREGYRVVTAKDGLDALERLAEERPVALLSDIEMPRMDGFDLVRNVRADPRLAGLPVVMITSRIAQKHRDYAAELGVQHYLGKPFSEEELLSLVAGFAQAAKVH